MNIVRTTRVLNVHIGTVLLPVSPRLVKSFRNSLFTTRIIQDSNKVEDSNAITKLEGPSSENTLKSVDDNDQPWYVEIMNEERMKLKSLDSHTVEIDFPPLSPKSLHDIASYLSERLGIKDIKIFDCRANSQGNNNGGEVYRKFSDFMVIGTAMSLKHCHNSYVELNKMLKSDYNHGGTAEGKININEQRRRQKRLLKKNSVNDKHSSMISAKNKMSDDAWYMIDCQTDGIVINILTEKKRYDLNLEELYAPEDEKFKYRNSCKSEDDSTMEMSSLSNSGNILAGLRRLSEQRRKYSTGARCAPNSTIEVTDCYKAALLNQDLKQAANFANILINKHNVAALQVLSQINKTLEELPVGKIPKLEVNDWRNLYQSLWPLIFEENSSELYWSQRFKFLSLLNTVNPRDYKCSKFVRDYFILKRVSMEPLNVTELKSFLRLIITNILHQSGFGMENLNNVVCQVLRLYDEETLPLYKDNEVLYLLLRTLVNDNGKKLDSLPTVIQHILRMSDGRPIPELVKSILQILAKTNSWSTYFLVWEYDSDKIMPGKDTRPWEQFIQYIVTSGDKNIMQRLISQGHLLWLKRYQVPVSPGIRTQLISLFNSVDPNRKQFHGLEQYLLND